MYWILVNLGLVKVTLWSLYFNTALDIGIIYALKKFMRQEFVPSSNLSLSSGFQIIFGFHSSVSCTSSSTSDTFRK